MPEQRPLITCPLSEEERNPQAGASVSAGDASPLFERFESAVSSSESGPHIPLPGRPASTTRHRGPVTAQMTRLERYGLAVLLAQEILCANPAHDELMVEQALQDIREEVKAGRKNQRDMPRLAAQARELIASAQERPRLSLVTEEEFEQLAYPRGRHE